MKNREKRRYDLICFDVDGTLVKHPAGQVIWEALNIRFGGSDEINRRHYDRFLQGKMSYEEWVRLDVGGWIEVGATREQILEVVSEFQLVDGARETLAELKRRGCKLAVISGTIDIVLDTLFPDHPFGDVYTNKIYFDEHGHVDSWQATPFDGRGKPEALKQIAAKHGVPLSRTAFVGDGENDVPLLGVPGYFVAFHPRSRKLTEGADLVVRDGGLHSLLDVF